MGELAALLAAFTWSATSVMLTSLAARTAPVVLSGLRLAAASLVMPAILLASGQASDIAAASAVTLFAVIGSGFIGYGLGDTLYISALGMLGMQRTFPITMALFITLTVVGGVLWLNEPFKWGLPVGAAMIGSGIYLIVIPARARALKAAEVPLPVLAAAEPALAGFADLPPEQHQAALRASPKDRVIAAQGYFLLIAVGILWAAATLWLASAKGDLGAVAAGVIRTPAGAIGLIAFAALTQPQALAKPFTNRRHIGAIVIAGIAGTAFGSLLYVYAVLEAGAARTAILSAASPVLAMPLSVIFLRERLNRRIGLGTLLCVLGIVLVVA
jgi:drug/metabolite transporter (DMT)-like permease